MEREPELRGHAGAEAKNRDSRAVVDTAYDVGGFDAPPVRIEGDAHVRHDRCVVGHLNRLGYHSTVSSRDVVRFSLKIIEEKKLQSLLASSIFVHVVTIHM